MIAAITGDYTAPACILAFGVGVALIVWAASKFYE